jgi:hypothetical protein
VDAGLGSAPVAGSFHAAPWFGATEIDELRALVDRRLAVITELGVPSS